MSFVGFVDRSFVGFVDRSLVGIVDGSLVGVVDGLLVGFIDVSLMVHWLDGHWLDQLLIQWLDDGVEVFLGAIVQKQGRMRNGHTE